MRPLVAHQADVDQNCGLWGDSSFTAARWISPPRTPPSHRRAPALIIPTHLRIRPVKLQATTPRRLSLLHRPPPARMVRYFRFKEILNRKINRTSLINRLWAVSYPVRPSDDRIANTFHRYYSIWLHLQTYRGCLRPSLLIRLLRFPLPVLLRQHYFHQRHIRHASGNLPE